uniref:Uncharacterized protein n=1 Tax=Klebsiella pneumoniae TaxID=573 RepID=Q764B4_KLEPN|nr:hypothetical protein [Klebsiella pneumoniae]BAD11029.1 hypothetical protein [Klebsiella pneumoniae]
MTKPLSLTNRSSSWVSGTKLSWFPRKIGLQFRKHFTCSLYRVCESLFVRGWMPPWMNAMRNWSGDMEVDLLQASPERCKEAGFQRPQTKSPGTFSTNSGRSIPQAASV